MFQSTRTYKDKKQPLLSKSAKYTTFCGLICFVIALVYTSSVIFGNKNKLVAINNSDDDGIGINKYGGSDSDDQENTNRNKYRGGGVLKSLGVGTNTNYFTKAKERRMKNRLKELEDQVAIYTRLLEETKGLKEEDHKSSIRKLDKAEKAAADAKRLLHEQSTLKSLQNGQK